jgi:hypothetical protein
MGRPVSHGSRPRPDDPGVGAEAAESKLGGVAGQLGSPPLQDKVLLWVAGPAAKCKPLAAAGRFQKT